MASRFVHRFLLRPILGLKVASDPSQASFIPGIKKFSTRPNLEMDMMKLAADNGPSSWKLCAAVCLIRMPILQDKLSKLENNYLDMKENMEFEQSVFNEWELESQRQQQLIKDIEAGTKNPEDVDFKETNQDLEDNYELSFNEFKANANTLTPEDDNKQNVNRRPHDSLILITKQQLGNDTVWMLPRVERTDYETMKDSAVRALNTHLGESCGAFFTSNAPSGFYKYKFPKGARGDDCVGAKLFIYNAFLPRDSSTSCSFEFDPNSLDESVLDHAWVARDELRSFMKPNYIAAVDKIVLKW